MIRSDKKLETFLQKNSLADKCKSYEDISYTETKCLGVMIYSS